MYNVCIIYMLNTCFIKNVLNMYDEHVWLTHGKRVILNMINSFQNLKKGFNNFQFISNIIQRNDTGTNTFNQRYTKKNQKQGKIIQI